MRSCRRIHQSRCKYAQGCAKPAVRARSASSAQQKYGVSTEEIEVDFEDFKADLTKSGGVE